MGKQVCGVKLMSPGVREVAPSGDEREDAGPGLLTLPPLKGTASRRSQASNQGNGRAGVAE